MPTGLLYLVQLHQLDSSNPSSRPCSRPGISHLVPGIMRVGISAGFVKCPLARVCAAGPEGLVSCGVKPAGMPQNGGIRTMLLALSRGMRSHRRARAFARAGF